MAGQRERRSTVSIGDAVVLNETATVSQGRLWVDVISGPVGGGGGTQYAEDTPHVSGDLVFMAGVVQQAADAALSSDADRSVLQVDETGYLKVNVKTGGTGGTQYAEDSLHVSGDTLTLAGVIQQTADAALSGDGDRSLLQVDASGWAKVNLKAPFPVASALNDTDANPTTSRVGANLLGWNGATWYRAGGSAANGLEVDITRIAAGTNNIGDVDIASLPNEGQQTMANSISVAISSDQSAIPVSGTVSVTEPVSVDDNGGSLTVDNPILSVVGGGLEATAQRVTIASDSTGVLSVDDNGASLTVDGTVAATQSGVWNITDITGTVSLPTGAATAANQVTEIASLSVIDDWDETDRAKVNVIVGQAGITAGAGAVAANTPRVTHASDDPVTTSVQLLDDTVYTDDTSTHATGTSKGLLVMAAATPTDTAVNANDIGAVAMTVNRQLHVSVQELIPGFGATNLGKREDDPHTSLDVGIMALGIRDDTLDVRSGAENDYEPFHMTATGRLYTSATVDAALPAGTNNIGDVDVLSLPNEGQQTMANSISVAVASDQASYYFATVLTNVSTKYDDSPTSATSGAFTVTPFRKFMLSYEVIKSAGTPTDIQFFVDYNNGATWVQYRNDFWGQLIYDDVATASKLSRCHSGDCVGTQMRVRVIATGTAAGAHFTVTNAKMECKN